MSSNESESYGAAPPGARWRRRAPRADLSAYVSAIIYYEERGVGLAGGVEAATLTTPLIISFGDAFGIGLGRASAVRERYHSFAAGLFPGPVSIESSGAAACVQIDFTPLGAYRFFGGSLRDIAGRIAPLDDLGDRELESLQRRLEDEPDWERRLDLAEGFVLARLRRVDRDDVAIDRAYSELLRTRGRARVAAVAAKLDCSRKHLTARFDSVFGLSPKTIARMIRFQRAASLARAPHHALADIAAACGYADQAHLTREFGEFAGATPTVWRPRPRSFAR